MLRHMIWIAVVLILLWSLPWRTHDKALQRVLAADAACAYDILQLPRQVRNVSALDAHAELLRTDLERGRSLEVVGASIDLAIERVKIAHEAVLAGPKDALTACNTSSLLASPADRPLGLNSRSQQCKNANYEQVPTSNIMQFIPLGEAPRIDCSELSELFRADGHYGSRLPLHESLRGYVGSIFFARSYATTSPRARSRSTTHS